MGPLKDAEFWVLIAFVIAFGYLGWKTRPLLEGALDKRAAKIRADLDEAERLREDAQRALAEYQLKQRDAVKEAEAITALARAEAEHAAAAAERELDAALDRRRKMTADRIALEEAKALAAVRDEAVAVAIAAVRRILGEALDADRRARLLDDAIAALPHALQ